MGETNNFKDYYWTASYKLGGVGVAGSVAPTDTLAMTDNFSEYSFLLGGFGYVGKWNKSGGASPFLEDQYDRIGLKFDAYVNRLNLFGVAMWQEDTLITAAPPISTINTAAYFLEADYMLTPWIVPLLRFERTTFSDRPNKTQIIPAARFAIRANTILLVEGRLFNKIEGTDVRTGTNELRLRFDMVF